MIVLDEAWDDWLGAGGEDDAKSFLMLPSPEELTAEADPRGKVTASARLGLFWLRNYPTVESSSGWVV